MGNLIGRSKDLSKRVIWCDTEGGIRGVSMWDVTFIDEGPGEPVRALRMFSVADAHKAGRAKLRKFIPMDVFASALKTSSVYMSEHSLMEDGLFGKGTYTRVDKGMADTVKAYLRDREGCVLCAWNMRAHDKHVLTRLVGAQDLGRMVLWDALPWFKSKYTLPKNGLSSDKAGTPRGVFGVARQGAAHASLADAAHLRELVLRAAYCLPSRDTSASKRASSHEMFSAARAEIAKQVEEEGWVPVGPAGAWSGAIPEGVYKE